VGRNIVHLRETKGWSRKELAHKLRVTAQRLGRWERGERQAPLAILVRTRYGLKGEKLTDFQLRPRRTRKSKKPAPTPDPVPPPTTEPPPAAAQAPTTQK